MKDKLLFMLNMDMKMESRCIFHYYEIAQNYFLNDFLVKALKITILETNYLGQFWAQRSKTFCAIFVRMRVNFY